MAGITLDLDLIHNTSAHLSMEAASEYEHSEPEENCSGTILLVEDEEYVREIVCEALEMYGYTVLRAREASGAIRIFEEYGGKIDLLLTDVVLPGLNGFELVQRLTARRPSLKAILMSGYEESSVLRCGIEDPRVVFMHKPFTLESLSRKVRASLESCVEFTHSFAN